MKNAFKVLVVASTFLVAFTVNAGTLWWQVDAGTTDQAFTMAILNVEGGNLAGPQRIAGANAEGTAPDQYVAVQNTDISNYSSSDYSFFVELVNGTVDNVVTKGASVNYTDLQQYIATGFMDGSALAAGFNMWAGAAAIPEPSSGLLLLMGGAMLALRRRRQM